MSLMETFVQVFEFDTRQADKAFADVRRSTDDIIEGMKQTQNAAQQGASGFNEFMQQLVVNIQSISGEKTIDVNINIADASANMDVLNTRLDAVKESVSQLDMQLQATDGELKRQDNSIALLDESYADLQLDLTTLNEEVTALSESEKQNVSAKQLALAVIKAMHGDYNDLITVIDNVKEKGVEATDNEITAQQQVQKTLDTTAEKYKHISKAVVSFAETALNSVGLTMDVSTIISESIARSAEIESLDKLGNKINIAAADIDAFAGSMAELGGSRESAQADLSAMAQSFGFAKNSMDQVLQTADEMQGMTFEQAKSSLSGMGVTDDKTVELMMKGRKELERMMGIQKDYSGISQESIEQSIKFNSAMASFKQTSGLLKNSFLEMVIPILAKGLEWLTKLTDFAKENKNFVVGFFSAIAIAVMAYYVPAMMKAAVSTLATTWPILAIIAIIALLAGVFALVYDDIMHFIDGNDSMIGRILDKYPALKSVIMALWEAFSVLYGYLETVVMFVAGIVVDSYNQMNEGLNIFLAWLSASIEDVIKWGKGFEDTFKTVSDAVVGIFKWLWTKVQEYLDFINKGLDAIKNGWSTVKNWLGFGDNKLEVEQTINRNIDAEGKITHQIPEPPSQIANEDAIKLAEVAVKHINILAANTLSSVTSQAISNQSNTTTETNVSIGEVKVETQATNAQDIAHDFNKAWRSDIEDIGQQHQSGMAK